MEKFRGGVYVKEKIKKVKITSSLLVQLKPYMYLADTLIPPLTEHSVTYRKKINMSGEDKRNSVRLLHEILFCVAVDI